MMQNVIKEIREELKMTQSQLAKAAGFNKVQQISGLENKQRGIGFNLLGKVVRNLAANGHNASLDVSLTINDKKIIIH
jgi:transcriptional regulator with XRE-family HTH domain